MPPAATRALDTIAALSYTPEESWGNRIEAHSRSAIWGEDAEAGPALADARNIESGQSLESIHRNSYVQVLRLCVTRSAGGLISR